MLASPRVSPPLATSSHASTVVTTGLALLAFAGNSLLCRMALGDGHISAVAFTQIRLVAGALMLLIIGLASGRLSGWRAEVRVAPGLALFAYAATFSFAYLSLDTGTGALLLFGAVQLTMIGKAIAAGDRLRATQWTGMGAASLGLIVLVAPGVHAPDPSGAILMSTAGVAWGVYTLTGKRARDPIASTTVNFVATVPLALALFAVTSGTFVASSRGVLLAVTSGAVTSALGYAIWYRALRGLGTATAAVVQLSVPVLAAIAGIVVLGETASLRLAVASLLVLGGIALVARRRDETSVSQTNDTPATNPLSKRPPAGPTSR